jgi:hypothetical protein
MELGISRNSLAGCLAGRYQPGYAKNMDFPLTRSVGVTAVELFYRAAFSPPSPPAYVVSVEPCYDPTPVLSPAFFSITAASQPPPGLSSMHHLYHLSHPIAQAPSQPLTSQSSQPSPLTRSGATMPRDSTTRVCLPARGKAATPAADVLVCLPFSCLGIDPSTLYVIGRIRLGLVWDCGRTWCQVCARERRSFDRCSAKRHETDFHSITLHLMNGQTNLHKSPCHCTRSPLGRAPLGFLRTSDDGLLIE